MRKLGINLHASKGLSDEAWIKASANAGFNAAFTGTYNPEKHVMLAELFAKYGVDCETIHAPFDGINDMWRECDGTKVIMDKLFGAVDCCAAANVPICVVHLSSGENAPHLTDFGRANFERLVEYSIGKNVRIAFENQRKLANIAWAFETFDESTGVGFCWDCGHEACFTPGRHYMPIFGDRLICTHIHDNTGIYNDDCHRLPFDGCVNFERVARQIRESGFEGTLMLEVAASKSEMYNDLAPELYLEKAAKVARKLAEMVDLDA